MNTNDHIKDLQKSIQGLPQAFGKAVQSIHPAVAKRIFNDGLNANGQSIGKYNSTKPLYVNPKKAPHSFAPAGKNGKNTFKNGKNHKTAFFSSYKEFRGKSGLPNDNVTLNLTGALLADFSSTQKIDQNTFSGKFTDPDNQKKADALVKKYGTSIFKLSAKEINDLKTALLDEKKKMGLL